MSLDSAHDAEHRLADLVSALDHLPAMIAYWDKDLHNQLANAAYLEWFGVTAAQLKGMHIRDLLGQELYARNLPYINGVLTGEEQVFERTLVDTVGRTRYTQASYIPHRVDGEVVGFFVLISDISARLAAEQSLKDSIANLALLRERQRIAADMHDHVLQSLYVAGVQLQTLALSATDETAALIERTRDRIDDAVTALRCSIAGLTRDIDPQRLLADLQQVIAAWTPALGFAPTLEVDGPLEAVPAPARPELLAVLQEALSNVARHARASAVGVSLVTTGSRVRLLVSDNGCGRSGSERASGLANMRARAERLGGSFSVSDNDPHGTIVDWQVPMTTSPDAVVVTQRAVTRASGTAPVGARVPARFDDPDLGERLETMTERQWDALPFGLVVMDREGAVEHYNTDESQRSGLHPDRVLGRNFFLDVGPCTNNYLIAERYLDLDRATDILDVTLDYVFTFRMRWTPVRLRLLARPGSARQYLVVTDR